MLATNRGANVGGHMRVHRRVFFLAFWDIDNLMIVGEICLIAGLLPISRELRRDYMVT